MSGASCSVERMIDERLAIIKNEVKSLDVSIPLEALQDIKIALLDIAELLEIMKNAKNFN